MAPTRTNDETQRVATLMARWQSRRDWRSIDSFFGHLRQSGVRVPVVGYDDESDDAFFMHSLYNHTVPTVAPCWKESIA